MPMSMSCQHLVVPVVFLHFLSVSGLVGKPVSHFLAEADHQNGGLHNNAEKSPALFVGVRTMAFDAWKRVGLDVEAARAMAMRKTTQPRTTDDENLEKPRFGYGKYLLWSSLSLLIWLAVAVGAAYFYHSHKQWPHASSDISVDFSSGFTSSLFGCFDNMSVCCLTLWCPCIQWAENVSMLQLLGFWVAFWMFIGWMALDHVTGGLVIWMFFAIFLTFFRQQIRDKFDMEKGSHQSMAWDFVSYCCCAPCAICQEARHIELACKAQHKAVQP